MTDDFAVVRGVLPPRGMTSLPDRPWKPAEANAAHASLNRIEARLRAAEQELENSKADRDAYWSMHEIAGKWEADAERLAEALRRIARAPTKSATWVGDVARAALAAHEEGK